MPSCSDPDIALRADHVHIREERLKKGPFGGHCLQQWHAAVGMVLDPKAFTATLALEPFGFVNRRVMMWCEFLHGLNKFRARVGSPRMQDASSSVARQGVPGSAGPTRD
jgi:hypothetical protein